MEEDVPNSCKHGRRQRGGFDDWVDWDDRSLVGLSTEQAKYLMACFSSEEKQRKPFGEWIVQFVKTNRRSEVSTDSLCAKAEELCVEARHRAGLEIPAEFSSTTSKPELVSITTENVVSWMGVSVRWFLEVLMKTPEMQILIEWDCPMWFVRNFSITVILRLRGVDQPGGCIVNHLDKFPSLPDGDSDDAICSKASVFISYTGSASLSDFLELLQDSKLEGAHVWSDILCVDQSAWTRRRDSDMLAFKERFLCDLRDWIGKIGVVMLLMNRWDDLTATFGQIWVIWEVFSSICGDAELFLFLPRQEEKRFVEEGLASEEGFQEIFSSLGNIDARNARAFDKEEKNIILRMIKSESNGIIGVNKNVAGFVRDWLLERGTAMYEAPNGAENGSELANNLGMLYRDMGQYDRALSLCRRNITLRRIPHVERHPETLASIRNAANSLLREGKLKEAESMYKEALDRMRESLGNQHPDTLEFISNTAELLRDQGKLTEAEPLYEEALKARRELLGDRHPDTLSSIHSMAVVLRGQGKLGQAGPLFKEALEGRREMLGNKHPETLSAINEMAIWLGGQGKLEEALALCKESLEGKRELLGNTHPDTLISVDTLAMLLREQGDLKEAGSFYMEALKIRRELVGNKHPDTLSSIHNTAILLSEQGKTEEAEPLYREALTIQRELLGNTHPDTLSAINDMAILLSDQGKLEKARPLHREALEGRRHLLGNKHPDTVTSINNMAMVLSEQGKLEEAEPLYKEVLEVRRELFGNQHPDTLSSIYNMAILLGDRGKSEEAELLYKEVLDARRQLGGSKEPNTATVVNKIPILISDRGKLNKAPPLCKEGEDAEGEILASENLGALRKDEMGRSSGLPGHELHNALNMESSGGPLTMARVLKTLKIELSESELEDLLDDFGHDIHGVEEFVAYIGSDIDDFLSSFPGLKQAKPQLLAFYDWFVTHYISADEDSKPPFNEVALAVHLGSSGPVTPAPLFGSNRNVVEPTGRTLQSAGATSLPVSTLEVVGGRDEISIMSEQQSPRMVQVTWQKKQDLSNVPVAFPGATRVKQLLDRFNETVDEFLPSLRVDWTDLERMYKRLKLLCPRGLVDSLVYAPRDLSVYVRTKDAFGYVVDIALCTHDRTHRSNVPLDGDIVNHCDNRVGVIEDRMRVPDVASLHPIVQDFVKERVVEAICCPTENLCIVELAPIYNPNRVSVPKDVSASSLWGYHGHSRLKFDFDRSSDDQDLFASWLVCMTVFQQERTEAEQEAIQKFIFDRYTDFEDRKMTKRLNYEAMFRSKGNEYRSGRLTWPLILGLCMAKNLKRELEPFQTTNDDLRSNIGEYRGLFTWKHTLCGGFAVALAAVVFVVVGVAVYKWEVSILGLFAPPFLIFAVVSVVTVNFYFLQDARPWAFLIPDDRFAPKLSMEDRDLAVRLILSPSCRRHFDGTNLTFTGETFAGTTKAFGYRFTYKDLRELGFGFCCDSWGREHLRVPKTGVLVRMERSRGDVDYFVRVQKDAEPKLLFAKPWYSSATCPG